MKNNKINDLGTLPQYWTQIEKLFLGTNLINTIPFEIGSCKELLVLDLSWLIIIFEIHYDCYDVL